MKLVWYVCDGKVEEYGRQEANWKNSFIVFARTPEDALLKVMKYHLRMMELIEIIWEGKGIEVIA